jgi:O-methyltransferase
MNSLVQKAKAFYNRTRWFFKHYDDFENYSKSQAAYLYGPITYYADGLATCLNSDFIRDPRFMVAYSAAAATNPWSGFTLQWRVYIVCWFANQVKHFEGDFVECGVNTGAYAKAIIKYIDFNSLGKEFYLLDTFSGLVPEQLTEDERKAGLAKYLDQYHERDIYQEVKKTFEGDRVRIIKGAVPDTLVECKADKVAYLSIDMNCVAPEIAAAEYFYDKVMPGGVIMLDDYGFPQHIHQKIAFDEFAARKNIQILSLPTGQGVIIKS